MVSAPGVAGVTWIVVNTIGSLTVTTAAADLVPADATIVAVPALNPVTSPVDDTPATDGALLVHATGEVLAPGDT